VKIRRIPLISLVLLVTAILIVTHQFLIWGKWWEWSDFLHHEAFAASLIFGALVLTIYANRRMKIIKVGKG